MLALLINFLPVVSMERRGKGEFMVEKFDKHCFHQLIKVNSNNDKSY